MARGGGIFGALLVVCVFFSLASPYFLTTTNLLNITLQASNIAVIAAGLAVVMIAGEIDLSIGSLEALSGSAAAVVIIRWGLPVSVGILVGLLVAALASAISGFMTCRLRVVSFVSTLAMLGIAQGAALLLTNGEALAGFPDSYTSIGTARVAGIPVPVIIAIVTLVLLHLMLTRTRFGTHVYAVGGNAASAAAAGIRPARIKFAALVLCGITAAIGGIILSSRLDAGNGLFGAQDLLSAVAAVVIGGTSLFGGVGGIPGTLGGVLVIATIENGMVLLDVQDFWKQIVVGSLILGAMGAHELAQRGKTGA
jgi:ribose transport system permease protein